MTGPSVLLTTDGTYPCYRGGVSVWCDQLIRKSPGVRFHLLAITYSPSDGPLFGGSENLVSQQILPLWGTEEPGPPSECFSTTLLRRLQTTHTKIRTQFVPAYETVLRCAMGRREPAELAEALLQLHEYFAEFDYARSVTSEEAWDSFLRVSREQNDSFTLEEATKCIRWLNRYLSVAAVPLPNTSVVHASMAGLAGIPGVLQKLKKSSGFLLTEHGIFLRELYLTLGRMPESTRCRKFLFGWFEAVGRMNYYYSDAVSSLCEFNRKWQIRLGARPESVRIIPNGSDPETFYPPAPADAPAVNARTTVLTMARIYRLKGIDHLLKAIRMVNDQVPGIHWRILGEVGDHEYYAYCLNLAKELGIAAHIEWGHTSDPAHAYRTADVFCLPSISEAMPYAVLEAMFSGCPVVATDVGGVAEMLGGAGLVVPPRNPRSMGRALLSLLSGDGAAAYRRELASRALARARALYDVDMSTQKFREVYDQLAARSGAAKLSAAR